MNLHVIESYTTCNIQRYLAISASQLVEQGHDLETIVERLRASAADSGTLIIPDDLQHLKRGGRLTPLAAALGGLLKSSRFCDWIVKVKARWMCTIRFVP